MPKKIVVKISGDKPKEVKDEIPSIEAVEPAVEEPEQTPAPPPPPPTLQQAVLTDDERLEKALNEYEKLQEAVQRQKMRDRKFQEHCISHDVDPRIMRNILARFAEERKMLVEKSREVLEYLNEAKNILDSEFAKVEEELIWYSIELNTMQMEPGKSEKSVGMRDELEAKISGLRKELPNLRNRIKALDEKIRELNEFPKLVQDRTTDKEVVQRILEDVKKRYILINGPRAEAVLRADIERTAQAESIPREYATILVWKKASGTASH